MHAEILLYMSFGKKIKLFLFYSGLPVTLSKSGLYPFLVSFLFGAMMQVILILRYFALKSILGVFLPLIFFFIIFPVADADCVFFHRASPVGTCFTDPHWKGTFLLENFLMIFIFKSYLCLIIICIVFDYHAYSDKYPSGRRRIWVNIILQSSQTATKM